VTVVEQSEGSRPRASSEVSRMGGFLSRAIAPSQYGSFEVYPF